MFFLAFRGLLLAVLLLSSTIARGQLLNEFLVNPNGGEGAQEFFELLGPPGTTISDVYLGSVEGDFTSTQGAFDRSFDLDGLAFGSNGLLMLVPTGYIWPPFPVETAVAEVLGTPTIENGTTSWLLIHSPTVAIVEGVDYDSNNDGNLDALPGDAVILDAVGVIDGGTGDLTYGGVQLDIVPGNSGASDMGTRFPGQDDPLSISAWFHGDQDGANTSTVYDLSQVSVNFPSNGILTPGHPNRGSHPLLNEFLVNPNGDDEAQEFFELLGPPGTTISDVYLGSVEGDFTSTQGAFDRSFDLDGLAFGSNGLLMLVPTGYIWPPFPVETAVAEIFLPASNFENGSTSWLLVRSPTVAIIEGVDYDSNNDGTLDALPEDAVILDAVGVIDGGTGDLTYGGVQLDIVPGNSTASDMGTRFPGQTDPLSLSAWFHGDQDGDNTSTVYDLSEVSTNFPSDGILTPGHPNVDEIPFFQDGFESGDLTGWM